MSNNIKKLRQFLDKFLIENVLSGDFLKLNFKEKLVTFLDVVSSHYSCFTDHSRAIVLEAIKQTVDSLERNTHPSFAKVTPPEPKPHRIWVSSFYAHLILEREFYSQDELEVWIKQAYPNLVLEKKFVEEAWKVLQIYGARRSPRKRTIDDSEDDRPPKRPRVKTVDNWLYKQKS
jgi:hypothetical protein